MRNYDNLARPLKHGVTLADLLRRPELKYQDLKEFDTLPELHPLVAEQVEIQVKYQGYLARQEAAIERFERMEKKLLPPDFPTIRLRASRRKQHLDSQRLSLVPLVRHPGYRG